MVTDKHDFVVLEAKRFEELAKKEQIADGLISLFHKKALSYGGINNDEIKLIDNLFNPKTIAELDEADALMWESYKAAPLPDLTPKKEPDEKDGANNG